MEALKLAWLGHPQVELKGQDVKLETRKATAMLAYLSLEAGDCPREVLAAMFWPEGSQQKALANLRRTLSSLNASLPGWIAADRETISLKRYAKLWVDVKAFDHLLIQLQEHGHSAKEVCDKCLLILDKAAGLYRCDFLEGLNLRDCPSFDEWQFFHRDTLRGQFADVLQGLSYGQSQRSQWDQAILSTRRWLSLDRLHEPASRVLMDLYSRSGQRVAALHQYDELARLLKEQLGQEPEEETRRLYEQIRGPKETQQGQASSEGSAFPLLKTKLYLPAAPVSRVIRSALVDRMSQIEQNALTLISAPAGFGKTTLLAEWIAQTPLPVAWLSLDNGDNDPYRFLSYLIAGLETVQEGLGVEAVQIMRSPQPIPPYLILASLINDLGKVPEPYALVLDDYQFITEHVVHETMGYLLDHLPVNMHILIATRADPPLQVGRLRANNQVLELRTQDLRFTPQEAAEFLNIVMKLDLAEEDIDKLEDRTEGWVVGLKMAALSIQGRDDASEFIQAFSGSHRYVLDYLVEEVLKRQPRHIHTFLLETSILEKLSGPLCDAVLGDEWKEPIQSDEVSALSSGQSVLEYLEQSNLFIISLDDDRQWYRYHHLFADLLSGQLSKEQSELLPTLHLRAASWYESIGMLPQAAHHALAAHDHERAAVLVEKLASALWDHGNYAMVFSWIRTLPEELVLGRPWLSMYRAWELAVDGKPREAELMLDVIEETLRSQTGDIDVQNLTGYIDYVRSVLADIRGDTEAMIAFDRAALEKLDSKNYVMRRGVTFQLGRAYHLAGDQQAAEDIWDNVIKTDQRTGTGFASIISLCMLTWLKVAVGRLQDARQICQDVIRWIDEVHEPHSSRTAGLVWLVNANVALESGDLLAAQRNILLAIECFEKWGNYYALLMGYVILASAQRRQRDYVNARISLQKADEVLRTREVYADALFWLRAEKVNLWLEQNDFTAAANYLKKHRITSSDAVSFVNELQYVALARVLIAQGKQEEAIQLLTRLEKCAEKGERSGRLIRILNTHAVALATHGKDNEAKRILEKSLRLAEPEGFNGVFLDEGEPMTRQLTQLRSSNSDPQLKNYADRLLAALSESEVAS